MLTMQGKGVSTGICVGPLHFFRRTGQTVERRRETDTTAQWQRFQMAQAKAIEALGELAEKARTNAGEEAALLFETHQMMAEDLDYVEAIEALVNDGLNAEAAVADTAAEFAGRFAAMDDEYMQARAAVADVKAAVRWVRANADAYGFDADNIAIWGESAGAYLAVMTALTPEVAELNGDVAENSERSSAVQALVSFYAPVEFWVMDAQGEALGMSKNFSGDSSFESAFVGQAVGADEEYTYRTWWGTYADALPEDFALAAYIAAGDGDTSVPYTQSVDLADDLTEVIGAEGVTLNILAGANHEDAAFYTDEHLAQVYDFLDGVLK